MGLAAAFTLALAVAVTGAGRYAGLTVNRVDLVVEGGVLPPSAPMLVDIETGDTYDPVAVRRSIKQLFSLGAFSDIKVEAQPDSSGVALTFRLYPALRFEGVSVQGLDEGPKELQRIRDSFLKDTRIRRGVLYDTSLVERAAERVEDELARSGFHWGKVEPEVAFRGSSAEVRLHARPGDRACLEALRIQGVSPSMENDIRHRLALEPGRFYSRRVLDKRVEQLIENWKSSGFYGAKAGVVETFEPPDTVRVELDVSLGPEVRVEVEGIGISNRTKNRLIPVLEEQSVSEDLLEESRANLQDYLREKGYRYADVVLERDRDESGRRLVLRFRVDPGEKIHVDDLRIEGSSTLPAARVLDVVATRPGGFRKTPFIPSAWQEDIAAVRSLLHREGFHRASVSGHYNPHAGDPTGVDLILRIDEGPRALIESIAVEGATEIPCTEVLAQTGLAVGAPFFAPRVVEARDRVLAFYRNRGFRRADVEVASELDDTATRVSIRFDVREGEQIFVKEVVVAGLDVTRQEALRREITVRPSEPLSTEKLMETRQRLIGTGIFREVNVEVLEEEPSGPYRDVLIRLEEGPRTSFGYGFGYNERELARVEAEITRRNLFGLNRTVSVFGRASIRGGRFITTYRQPKFFGLNLPVFFSAFYQEQDRTSFDYIQKGVGFQVSRSLSENRTVFFRYRFERTDVTRLDIPPDELPREYRDIRLSTASVSQVTDTRDDPLTPSRGQFRLLDFEVSPKFLGSKSPYVKGLAQQFFYFPLPARLTGVVGLRLGIGQTFRQDRDALLPITERFFAGGANTLRGFGLDQASPKDPFGNPVGGNVLTLLNFELRFPLLRKLGGVIFSDNGTVYRRLQVIQLLNWRYNVGFGFRYDTPLGPLRVDWGFKIDLRPGEPPSRVHVSLGHAF